MKINCMIMKTAIIDSVFKILDREVKACSIVALVKGEDGKYGPDTMFIGSTEDVRESFKLAILEQENTWLDEMLTDVLMDVWDKHGEEVSGDAAPAESKEEGGEE